MDIGKLVDKHFDEIEVTNINYEPVDDSTHDCSNIYLDIPTEIIRAYQEAKGLGADEFNPAEFFKDAGLAEKLENYKDNISVAKMGCDLPSILEYLHGDIVGYCAGVDYSKETTDINISEPATYEAD